MEQSSEREAPGLLLTLGLATGPMLTMVDSSVVNVALASITRSLHSSLAVTEWVASGYLLAAAIALPATAYLAKRLGSDRTYLGSIVGFTLLSALCALAPNAGSLVALRVLQGAFGAPLVPLAIARFLGGGEGGTDFSLNSPAAWVGGVVFFLAPALGPTVGGLLIDSVGWPWIFWINVPIGLAGIAAALRAGLHDPRDASTRFDMTGFLLLGTGTGLLTFGAAQAPNAGWLGAGSLPFWSLGAVLVLAYVAWAATRRRALLDVHLLRRRLPYIGTLVASIAAVVMYAMLIVVPTYLQLAQGVSPLTAGLVLLPQGIATGLGIPLGARVAARIGVRPTAVAGMAALVVGTLVLLPVGPGTPLWLLAAVLCGRGCSGGFVIQPLLSAMLAGLSDHETADLSTLVRVATGIAGSVGIAVFLTIFGERERVEITSALSQLHASAGLALAAGNQGMASLSVAAVPPSVRPLLETAAARAFDQTALGLVALALLGVVLAFALPEDSSGAVEGRKVTMRAPEDPD